MSVDDPYYLEGVRSQLKPREWLNMLTSGSGVDPDCHFILDGIMNGFRVLDRTVDLPKYNCKNYNSCFGIDNLSKLRGIVQSELEVGKFSKVNATPRCVHAMGTIKKKGSEKIRPITDCSRPEFSVNDCMEGVQDKFSYISIDQIVKVIVEGKHLFASTLDLASAYRSVLICPENREFFWYCFGWNLLYG